MELELDCSLSPKPLKPCSTPCRRHTVCCHLVQGSPIPVQVHSLRAPMTTSFPGPDVSVSCLTGHVRAALQRALPQHGAQHVSGKAHPVWAGGRADQPLQLGHQLSNAASSEQGSDVGAASDLGGTAVPLKRPAHPVPIGTTDRGAGEPTDAGSSEHAVDAHRQALGNGSTAMTEATAQRLIDALNAHHTGLAETSQALSQASSDLKGVCLLLKGPRHRF